MPHEIDIMMGQKIRNYRTWKGMTQEILAKKLSISCQQLQKYEKGLNRIGLSRFFEIAEALGVEPIYFFNYTEEKNLTTISEEQIEFLKALEVLPLKARKAIYRLCLNLGNGAPKRKRKS